MRPAPTRSGHAGRTVRSAASDPTITQPRARLSLLWPYLRPHRAVLLLVTGISIVGAVLSVAQPAVVGLVINSVQDSKPLTGIVALLVVLVLATAVISGVQQYLLQRTAEGVVLDTRRLLVSRLLRLPINEFDTRRTGDLVSRVGSDTTLLRSVVTSGLVDAVSGALVFVGSVIAMSLISLPLLGADADRGRGGDRHRHRARRPHPEADPDRADPGRGARCRGGAGRSPGSAPFVRPAPPSARRSSWKRWRATPMAPASGWRR